jgi:endo-1,3-1,4-beta-glycanase ExoK
MEVNKTGDDMKTIFTVPRKIGSAALALAMLSGNANAGFWDGFDSGSGPDTSKWEVANWNNGDIFGCTFAYSEAYRMSWGALALNVNASNPNSVRCAEVRTWRTFTYGKFVTRIQPSYLQGSDTSIFLYTGTAGTASHFEIDIEFLRGGSVIHTNVWTAGRQNYVQYNTANNGWRTIGFEWRPTFIRWFHVNADGSETEFRRVYVSISTPMRLMLNHWVGNNSAGAVNFVGNYSRGQGGTAYYDWVRVDD